MADIQDLRIADDAEAETIMRQYKATGDLSLRNALVLYYARFIEIAIYNMRSILLSRIPFEDFYNQGVLALIDSIDRFCPDRGASFHTYLFKGVRGALLNYMRKQNWLPNRVQEARRDISQARGALRSELLREPTDRELAGRLGVSEEKLGQLQLEIASTESVSLEEMMEDTYGAFLDRAFDSADDEVEKNLLEEELRAVLAGAIAKLPPRQRQVVTMCYYENLNLREMGEILGLTQQRVSQIRSAALATLHDAISAYMQDGRNVQERNDRSACGEP